jgi:hypothetical protein
MDDIGALLIETGRNLDGDIRIARCVDGLPSCLSLRASHRRKDAKRQHYCYCNAQAHHLISSNILVAGRLPEGYSTMCLASIAMLQPTVTVDNSPSRQLPDLGDLCACLAIWLS